MMNETTLVLSSVLWPFLAALILTMMGQRDEALRDRLHAPAAMMELFLCMLLMRVLPGEGAAFSLPGFAGLGLSFRVDGFRVLYACITSLLWLMAMLYSPGYFGSDPHRGRFYGFCFLVQGSVIGLFLSADYFTTFLFFELMSLTSYPLVAHDETSGALRSAETYLAVSIMGGLAILMALFLIQNAFGNLEFAYLSACCQGLTDKNALYLPGILLLIGFGAKAGAFPLHIWLPKAHPSAPAPASALLSGILTKTGLFGVLVTSTTFFGGDLLWGLILLVPAALTMLWGAVLGLFSTDIKKTLACSSVSQIGFALVGTSMLILLGDHNGLAAFGIILQMVNHSLIKSMLFFISGIAAHNLHTLNLNALRGYGRGKPLLGFTFLVGALSISGVPAFSGYISKTLLHESVVEAIHLFHGLSLETLLSGVEMVFIVTGGLTAAYMTKLFVVLFIEHPAQASSNKGYLSRSGAVALLIPACLLIVLGLFPSVMNALAALCLPFLQGHAPAHLPDYFAWVNLKGALLSLSIGAGIYLLIVRTWLMKRLPDGSHELLQRWPAWLDLEELVFRPGLRLLSAIGGAAASLLSRLPDMAVQLLFALSKQAAAILCHLPDYLLYRWLPRLRQPDEEGTPEYSLTFSYTLLTFGIGFSAILIYMVLQAARQMDVLF